MIEFGFAIAVRIVNADLDQEELIEVRIDVNASNNSDAFMAAGNTRAN